MTPRLLSASSLSSDNVQNSAGENLGSIKDLMINLESGSVEYAVVQFGGVLGLGSKYFAVPFGSLAVDTGKKVLILDTPKDTLAKAEGFDHDNWPDFADAAWRDRTRVTFAARV